MVRPKALQEKGLLPERCTVDSGYVDAELLMQSQGDYGVDLFGPTRADLTWLAKQDEGFASKDLMIDWEKQQAHCPRGHT